ncbi:MAG TPA: EamA family transporter, partial [Spirochaetaceae bacterium]|nr:EamA family transporter [Spirochaetaceae bacterium]
MNSKHAGAGLGALALAATAFFWSLAGIFIKLVDWNPFAIAAGRSLIAAVFMWIIIRKPKFTFSWPQIGAALASTATMLLFVYANKNTTSANAILLQYGSPIYTGILGAIIIKERPRAEHILGFLAVAVGMVLFFMGGIGGGSTKGDIAAIASGITFAFYYVFMRMQKDGSPVESSLLAHLLTAAIALVVALFLPAPVFSAQAVGAVLGLGVLQIGVASLLFAWGIKRVPAMEGILIAGLEPVFNPLWVFLLLGEKPGVNALIGGGIILAAVFGSSIISARRDARSAAAEARVAAAEP